MSTTAIVIATFLLVTVLPQSECFAIQNASNSDRQLYRTIGEISFTSGQLTKGLRESNRPKLNCVQGGNGCVDACNSVEIDKLFCRQSEDYGANTSAVWKCETSSIDTNEFYIQKAFVQCEGWDNTSDSYVSLESCFVEYAICRVRGVYGGGHEVEARRRIRRDSSDDSRTTFIVIFIVVAIIPCISIIVGIVMRCIRWNYRETDVPFEPPPPRQPYRAPVQSTPPYPTTPGMQPSPNPPYPTTPGAQTNGNPPYPIANGAQPSPNPPYPSAPGSQPNGNPPYPAAPGAQPNPSYPA